MQYWIKRIQLKSGEIVTEQELLPTENLFDGTTPPIGAVLKVRCRGRELSAKVTWTNHPAQEDSAVCLRVEEI